MKVTDPTPDLQNQQKRLDCDKRKGAFPRLSQMGWPVAHNVGEIKENSLQVLKTAVNLHQKNKDRQKTIEN